MKQLFSGILLLLTLGCFAQNAKTKLETFITEKENYMFRTINFNVPAFDRKQKIDSVSFEGSLIIPKNGFDKVVIIKPGTGYNTRNTHTYLAEALLDNNIAVFRYDERDIGNSKGKGGGDMLYTATMMGAELACAFNTLKQNTELKGKKIGIIGHSLGGVAVIDALKDNIHPDFLVLLSTPVVSGKDMFLYQLQHEENGFNDYFLYDTLEEKQKTCSNLVDFYLENHDDKNYWSKYKKYKKKIGYTKNKYNSRFPFLIGKTEKDLIIKNNSNLFKNINIPVFYMIGDQDVLVDPISNTNLLNSYNNPTISITILEEENHFFAKENPYKIHEEPKKAIVNWIITQ